MVYFQVNHIGFKCGYSKNNCPKNADNCGTYIKNKLKDLGFEIDSNFEIFEIDSEEKKQQLERDIIWQKFLDILSIKTIIIMDKESGLILLNYDVSGIGIDANLLSGFIQANITFSESSKISNGSLKSFYKYHFYEFQYKSFNILLKDGQIIRVCLILEHKASDKMKNQIFQFISEFESSFEDELKEFRNSGACPFPNLMDFIMKSFNVNLIFPMTLAHSISPLELQ